VDRIRERDGPEEALEAIEPLTQWTLHEVVLQAVIKAAREADDAVREIFWSEIADEAKAAQATLEALDKAERAGR
jgi:hypothetical protein